MLGAAVGWQVHGIQEAAVDWFDGAVRPPQLHDEFCPVTMAPAGIGTRNQSAIEEEGALPSRQGEFERTGGVQHEDLAAFVFERAGIAGINPDRQVAESRELIGNEWAVAEADFGIIGPVPRAIIVGAGSSAQGQDGAGVARHKNHALGVGAAVLRYGARSEQLAENDLRRSAGLADIGAEFHAVRPPLLIGRWIDSKVEKHLAFVALERKDDLSGRLEHLHQIPVEAAERARLGPFDQQRSRVRDRIAKPARQPFQPGGGKSRRPQDGRESHPQTVTGKVSGRDGIDAETVHGLPGTF